MTSTCPSCSLECRKEELVTLYPCQCELCFRCVLSQQATNTEDAFTHCGQVVVKHKTLSRKREREGYSSSEVEHRAKKAKTPNVDLNVWKTRNYILEKKRAGTLKSMMGQDGLILTEQTLLGPDANGEPKTAHLAFSAVPKHASMDFTTKNSLIEHFKIFHPILISSSKTRSSNIMSTDELLDHYMSTDRRALLLCMLAIATGHTSFEGFKTEYTNNDKVDAVPNAVMAIGMATDVLARAVNPREVGPAVKCMTNMHMHAAEQLCGKTLSKFKVVTSVSANTKYSAKEVIKACLDTEMIYGPKDPVALMSDNVNWKVIGGNKSGTVMSWTLVAHRLPKSDDEIACFYGDDALSRERKDWVEDFVKKFRDDDLIAKVFLASDSDYENLNELALILIKAVLMSYKTLSNADYAAMNEAKEYRMEQGFPKLERMFNETDLESLASKLACEESVATHQADEEEPSMQPNTLFENEKIVPSIPIDANFAERDSIVELFEYLLRIKETQLRQWQEDGEQGVPPISNDLLLFLCDGDPVKTGLTIQATDVAGRYSDIFMLVGAFHAFMEVFKKSNAREKDFLTHLVKPFYSKKEDGNATEQNVSYFLSFHDPIQPEHEVGSMLVAIIHTAVVEMKKSGRAEATPAHVLTYMRERAKASPQDMRLFMEFKYLVMVLLYRKAERGNKIDLYFACMRLSLPFLMAQNAKNYVLIYTETLKFWETASERDREVIRKYGFTLQTPNGVNVGVDFGMEKYVRLVREGTGKIKRAGMELKVESAALTGMDKAATEGIKCPNVYMGKNVQRYDGRVLAMTMDTLAEMGAWSSEQEQKPREVDTESVYSMLEPKKRLPRELLQTDSFGTDLLIPYLKRFTLSTERVVERTDSGMRKREYTAEAAEKEAKRLIGVSVSVSKARLEEGTVVELLDEIKALEPHVTTDFPTDMKKFAKSKKPAIKETLVKLRKQAFSNNRDLQEQFANAAKDKAYGGKSTPENRGEELDRKFWKTDMDGHASLTTYTVNLTDIEE